MKLFITAVLFFSLSFYLSAQSTYPASFIKKFHELHLNDKYDLKPYIKPGFLKADFSGDRMEDVAALISERKTKKEGILIINGGSNHFYILGAGTKFGNGGDDFKWMKGWTLYKDKIAYESQFSNDGDIIESKKIILKRHAFYIYSLEDGEPNSGGIIYWSCKKYIWIHQGE